MTTSESTLTRLIRGTFSALVGLSTVGCALLAGAGWLAPELVESRIVDPSNTDAYAQFESFGQAEAILWLTMWVAPVLALGGVLLWWKRQRLAGWMEGAGRSLWRVTASPDFSAVGPLGRVVPLLKRAAILGSLVLAIGHWAGALGQRLHDWPYYRFHDGGEVLPNISESNREVVRYLRQATPENCRIFVVSDQKLFFLSYYLRPRSLYHRMHPTAEHLIPRANQARQLAAYRLEELPPEVWDCHPDFVLEYFEGPEYVDPARTTADSAWLRFIRQRMGDPTHVPGYVVVLRRWPLTEGPR